MYMLKDIFTLFTSITRARSRLHGRAGGFSTRAANREACRQAGTDLIILAMHPPSKNRPSWRLPIAPGCGKGRKFPGYQSRFGDGHPNRRQCTATARSTGKRCRCDPVQGSPRCQKHGGHRLAYLAAQEQLGNRFVSLVSGKAAARKGLARLSVVEPYPKDVPWLDFPVDRGLVIEAERNRELAPKVWLGVTAQAAAKAYRGARGPLRIAPPAARAAPKLADSAHDRPSAGSQDDVEVTQILLVAPGHSRGPSVIAVSLSPLTKCRLLARASLVWTTTAVGSFARPSASDAGAP